MVCTCVSVYEADHPTGRAENDIVVVQTVAHQPLVEVLLLGFLRDTEKHKQNTTQQNKTKQNRAEQNRAVQNRAEQSRAEQNRAEQ